MPDEVTGTATAGVRVVDVDPYDDAALAAWHAVRSVSQRHGREDTASVWTLPELTALVRQPSERRWRANVSAVRDGEVVGAGLLVGSLVDNLDSVELEVDVLPAHRGQGIGATVLAHLEGVAAGRGRRVLQSEVSWPYDAHPDGVGEPGVEWARAHGFALGIVDVQRLLRLPVATEVLDDLAAAAAPHHASYTLRAWSGPVPDDLVEGWAALAGSLMTEAPTGEMTREPEVLDVAAVREQEALASTQGRTKYHAVALDGSGAVVAYTEMATTIHEPGLAYQWGTLVRRDHRGHRLGAAVKVANLRLLQSMRPDVERVRTWNAEVNAHMVSVNVALGFRPVERLGELQKLL